MSAGHIANLCFTVGICVPLCGAFVIQFGMGELPCPLCLLQRLGMTGIAVGAMMNLRFGVRPSHYGVSLLSALFGGSVSIRQILLHITPGDPGFGDAVLGMHLYTWALLIFAATILLIGLMMLVGGSCIQAQCDPPAAMDHLTKLVLALAITVTFVNAVATFSMCGVWPCPDSPTTYWLFSSSP